MDFKSITIEKETPDSSNYQPLFSLPPYHLYDFLFSF